VKLVSVVLLRVLHVLDPLAYTCQKILWG